MSEKTGDDQCVPDNVRTLTDKTCAHCKRPIVKGQRYFNLRVPDGSEQPVHNTCMEDGTR